jgi:hypothetical protein
MAKTASGASRWRRIDDTAPRNRQRKRQRPALKDSPRFAPTVAPPPDQRRPITIDPPCGAGRPGQISRTVVIETSGVPVCEQVDADDCNVFVRCVPLNLALAWLSPYRKERYA